MKLDIYIPSYKRNDKLLLCISSINAAATQAKSHKVFVTASFSREEDHYGFSESMCGFRSLISMRIEMFPLEYKAPIFWNHYLRDFNGDAFVYLNDDVVVEPNFINALVQDLAEFGTDNLIGIKQVNGQHDKHGCSAAFGALGHKFIDRFKDRQVFCPAYHSLYIDSELQEYAESINKFVPSERTGLIHYHPSYTGENPDDTHKHNRTHKQDDIETRKRRKAAGLLWGNSYEL